jgi:hypothetical protein
MVLTIHLILVSDGINDISNLASAFGIDCIIHISYCCDDWYDESICVFDGTLFDGIYKLCSSVSN